MAQLHEVSSLFPGRFGYNMILLKNARTSMLKNSSALTYLMRTKACGILTFWRRNASFIKKRQNFSYSEVVSGNIFQNFT
jgi:hypothetical protein